MQDSERWLGIMQSGNPREIKHLGRLVQNYDDVHWASVRFEVVLRANILKFTQNADLRQALDRTGVRVMVEASPFDAIWGIKAAATDPEACHPRLWRGAIVLVKALQSFR